MADNICVRNSVKRVQRSFGYDDADAILQVLSEVEDSRTKKFSFRASKRIENKILPFVQKSRPRRREEFFTQRIIVSSANNPKFGKISPLAASLAVKLFSRMIARKIWRENIVYKRQAWLDGYPVSYDQRDLMLRCRRVAKRIVLRRVKLALQAN